MVDCGLDCTRCTYVQLVQRITFEGSKADVWCYEFISKKAPSNVTDRHRFQPCLAEYAAEVIFIDDLSWVAGLEILAHSLPVRFEWSKHTFIQWLQEMRGIWR